jgi:nucleotide-binding universal stress UspA family protein
MARSTYDRILVPLDGSPLAEQVLPYLEPLTAKLGSTIILLRATKAPGTLIFGTAAGAEPVGGPVVDPTPLVERERQEAAAYLRVVAEGLRRNGVAVECEQAEGPAEEIIAARARSLGADLVAMTTHGRGGLGRLVFGSVADAVLQSAPCPILLVRATKDGAHSA